MRGPIRASLFASLFLAVSASAQEQWLQLTSPTTSDMISVQFTDSTTGYMAGDAGKIFKTTDAAVSWTAQVSGVTQKFSSIRFVNATNGIAIGAAGVILRTTNAGASWVLRTSGTTEDLKALSFTTATTAYVVGNAGTILKTMDGGATWSAMTSGTTKNLNAIHMLDSIHGYIAGESLVNSSGGLSTILKTTNGNTWSDLSGPTMGTAYSIFAFDSTKIFAANYGAVLYKSTNGGASWSGGSVPDLFDGYSTIYFLNQNVGYLFFGGGYVRKTTDGGTTWVTQATPSGATLRGMSFTNINTGYVVSEGGKIFKHVYTPPVTPALSAPTNALVDAALSLNLSWGVVPFTSTYRVQVATDAGFASVVLDDSTLLSATTFLENLNTSTTYYWRVNAKNPGGTSAWSTVRSFTTVPPPPALPPVLSAPVSGATNVAVSNTLSWAAAAGATVYRVQLSTNAGFTAIVKDTTQAGLSKLVGPLTNATTYFWRVNAENPGGASAFSAGSSFTTVAIPAAPVPSAPVTSSVNVALSPTLSWAASTNALTYRVQLSTDSTFPSTVVNDSTVTGTSRAVGPLTNNTRYFWRVNAKHGGTSAYSSTMIFTTMPVAPAATTLSTPANAATNIVLSPTLTWTAVSTATNYRVQVSADQTFTTTLVDDSSATGTSTGVGPLQPGIVYYWRVAAHNGGGYSAFTSNRSFTTVPAIPVVPTLTSPGNGAVSVAVSTSLTWGAAGGATNYSVQLSRDSLFGSFVVQDTTLTTTTRAVSSLLYNTKYYWRVNARNVGGTSAFSAFSRFTTVALPVPGLTAPAQNATGIALSPALTWNAVTGATSYHVQFGSDSLFASTIVNDTAITAASYTAGPLTPGASYYWRVRARNLTGSDWSIGDWAVTQKFTVLALPAVPLLSSPGVDSTAVSITPNLVWLSAAGASTYRIQLATDSLFSAPVLNDSTLTSTTRAAGTLNYGTKYYWRANAKNASGTSAYSAIRAFTTLSVGVPVLSSPSNNATGIPVTTTLGWNASSGATSYAVQVSTDSTFASLAFTDLAAVATTRTVGPLTSNTAYFWRVNATAPGGVSAWSAPWKFTTMAIAAAPVLLSPAADTVGVIVTPTLSWSAAAGAATYRVQLATDSTFATTILNDSTVTATTRAAGTLANATTYYWRVNSKNGGGTSAYSPVRRFVTITATALARAIGLKATGLRDGAALQFNLLTGAHVQIRLYDSRGMLVTNLMDEQKAAGSYSISLPQHNAAALYLIDFRAGSYRQVLKVIR